VLVGGVVVADHVQAGAGSVENLNPSVRCGARPNRRHTRVMLSWLTLSFFSRANRPERSAMLAVVDWRDLQLWAEAVRNDQE
jgi:hypothetical protein